MSVRTDRAVRLIQRLNAKFGEGLTAEVIQYEETGGSGGGGGGGEEGSTPIYDPEQTRFGGSEGSGGSVGAEVGTDDAAIVTVVPIHAGPLSRVRGRIEHGDTLESGSGFIVIPAVNRPDGVPLVPKLGDTVRIRGVSYSVSDSKEIPAGDGVAGFRIGLAG